MKASKLRFNYEFSRVYKRGKFATGKYLSIHCFKRYNGIKHNLTVIPHDINRVGFCANKRTLGAVGRNRARRIMREAYRKLEEKLPVGYDLVFTFKLKNKLDMPDSNLVSREMTNLMLRLKLLDSDRNKVDSF